MTLPNDTTLVIGPNASMTAGMAVAAMGVMATVSLGIAALFAWYGFWPILAFAGLELAALGLALHVVLRRNRYREVIVFEGSRLRVDCGMVGGGARLSIDWQRSATRVLLEPGSHRNDPTTLSLVNGSRRLTLGRCLTDEGREAIAQRLRELILAGWRVSTQESAKDMTPDGN